MTRRADVGALLDALPEEDAAIDALDPATRRVVADVWLARARSELAIGQTFGAIAAFAIGAGLPAEAQWLAARAVGDEVRHAELCRAVASRYAGEQQAWPVLAASERAHVAAPREMQATLQLVATTCVQETLGGAFLEHALARTSAPTARAALRELLADEVSHGRIGWAHLASLDGASRAALAPYLPSLIDRCMEVWRARVEGLPDDAPPEHGCPARGEILEVVESALADLVLAGFEHVGVPLA